MGEAGCPTKLTKEMLTKIKECILNDKNLKETAKICEVPESTMYCWHSDNYLSLADKIEGWKRDYKLQLAEGNIKEILKMDVERKESLKVVADMSKFTAETLGKKSYSKSISSTVEHSVELTLDDKQVERLLKRKDKE